MEFDSCQAEELPSRETAGERVDVGKVGCRLPGILFGYIRPEGGTAEGMELYAGADPQRMGDELRRSRHIQFNGIHTCFEKMVGIHGADRKCKCQQDVRGEFQRREHVNGKNDDDIEPSGQGVCRTREVKQEQDQNEAGKPADDQPVEYPHPVCPDDGNHEQRGDEYKSHTAQDHDSEEIDASGKKQPVYV